MPVAEIITIGTELLLGEKIDTNTRFIARTLRDVGIDIYRTTSVGDNKLRIAQAIREALTRADIIITTGGLGPTIDDPTRDAVAMAFDVPTVFDNHLWEQILERFKLRGRIPSENNKRMAYIPQGAIGLENKVGTAPAFVIAKQDKCVISLPGVPKEMEYLMEYQVIPFLKKEYNLHQVIKAKVIHTAGIGESHLDELIGDLERLSNPTVGLAAHAGQVDIRITAKANSADEAITLIEKIENQIRQKAGEWIYGVDNETLEGAVLRLIGELNYHLWVVENSSSCTLIPRLSINPNAFIGGLYIPTPVDEEKRLILLNAPPLNHKPLVCMGIFLAKDEDRTLMRHYLLFDKLTKITEHVYGGPSKMANEWASNISLKLLQDFLLQQKGN